MSAAAPPAGLSPVIQNQIFEQISEYVDAWDRRAREEDPDYGGARKIPIVLALDRSLVGPSQTPLVSRERFEFLIPEVMGYVPEPATFVCRVCGLVKPMKDVNDLDQNKAGFAPGSVDGCVNAARGQACRANWEQLDVVWVHWSGDYAPISPVARRFYDDQIVHVGKCGLCGHEHFRLIRNGPQFKDWYFECANQGCRTRREMRQMDELTMKQIGRQCIRGEDGHVMAELNMLRVSYRASQAYYVHGDRLLVFDENRWLDLLKGSRASELEAFLAKRYGYPRRARSDAECETLLKAAGRGAEWAPYVATRKIAVDMRRQGMPEMAIEALDRSLRETEAKWATEVFGDSGSGSPELNRRVGARSAWVRRYDPMRLVIEHQTLDHERLSSRVMGRGGLPVCTRVDAPDRHMIPNGLSPNEVDRMNAETRKRLRSMGIADMCLLRDFRVCEFTFAYTRVEAYPRTTQEDREMPVRLNLFQQFRRDQGSGGRHPIYTVSQSNEAFYVRIDEDLVREWLDENGVGLATAPGQRLGGPLIEAFESERFCRFIDAYRKEKFTPRDAYAFAFGLLHTFSHLLIDTVSELSGLDQGSFGEHLFVPDLAFVVYRRGVTMDLGNLSSMWRSYANPVTGNQVLADVADSIALRCGSGSLCAMRGGACPDCVMIPETSCLCGNNLLSRAFLRGYGVAHWDADETPIVGFLKMARARAGAAPGAAVA